MIVLFSLAAKGHKGCVELLLNNNASLNGKDKVRIILICSYYVVHNVNYVKIYAYKELQTFL